MTKDYSKGKIYILRSADTEDIYIGSTIQPLSVRLSKHKNQYKAYLAEKYHNCSSFKLISLGTAYIELIEIFPCNTQEELNAREGYHMRATPNCINKNIAGRTYKQYYIDNATIINEKANIKNECLCGGKYTTSHKAHHENTLKHQTYIHQMKSTK